MFRAIKHEQESDIAFVNPLRAKFTDLGELRDPLSH